MQNAAAAKILFAKPPKGVLAAAEVKAELIVSAFVSVLPDAVNATDGVAKLQEKYWGSVPQEKFTEPVKPPWGVTASVTAPEPEKGIVKLDGLALAVKPGLTIVSVNVAEVLPVKFASPPYAAWTMTVPAASKDVVRVATPFASVAVPIEAVPL